MSEITRTISSVTANITAVKVIDGKKSLESVKVDGIPAKYDTEEKVLRFVKKSIPAAVMVDSMEVTSKLYAMPEDAFIARAHKADARSKETRDTISKEIIGKLAITTEVTPDRQLVMGARIIPNRFTDCDKACSYLRKHEGKHIISVDEIQLVKQLMYMTVSDFIAAAEVRPLRGTEAK